MQKILTVPAPVKDEGLVYVAGNHFVSLSSITPSGAVQTLSHLRASLGALVEYEGAPLFHLLLDGAPLPEGEHGYVHDCLPRFFCTQGALEIEQLLFAPEGRRGFVFRVSLAAKAAVSGTLSLRCSPREVSRTVFKRRPLSAAMDFGTDDWTGTAFVELIAGGGLSALAIAADGGRNTASDTSMETAVDFELAAGARKTLWFYVGVGAELDGARLANIDLRRRGEALYTKQVRTQAARHTDIPEDPVLAAVANLNLNYCYNFSAGYALDTGELMLTTSRSSRYYVSGAYWARDCMLWAFPSLLRADRAFARRALLTACTRYLERGADHALYLNGMSLYPGFELDELVAPVIALERYVTQTGECEILELPEIRNALDYTARQLAHWRDDETGLYRTELSPSDDPEPYPFLTYDNYLALAALRFMNGRAGDFAHEITALETALMRHCQATDGARTILAWSTDGQGNHVFYDNPPGSLVLTAYYGGICADDPVYKATVAHYFSTENPWFTQNDLLFGAGCEHAPEPWPMSLCNLLLARGADEAVLRALRAMRMDNGIACETVTPDGALCTGAAFATSAGFVANAIFEAYGR